MDLTKEVMSDCDHEEDGGRVDDDNEEDGEEEVVYREKEREDGVARGECGVKGRKKKKWTKLEDSRLISAVNYFSSGGVIGGEEQVSKEGQTDLLSLSGKKRLAQQTSWSEISSLIPSRSAKQCRERWCYNLDPRIKHGPFSVEEDAILLKAQALLKNQWAAIAKFLPGRTENAVKTRYTSIQRAKRREWSTEEDHRLLTLYRDLGGKWELMVTHFSNRTANALKTRCTFLRKSKGGPLDVHDCAQDDLETGHVRQIWLQPHLIDTIDLHALTGTTTIAPTTIALPSSEHDTSTNQVNTKEISTTCLPLFKMGFDSSDMVVKGLAWVNHGVVQDNSLTVADKSKLIASTDMLFQSYVGLKAKRILERQGVPHTSTLLQSTN